MKSIIACMGLLLLLTLCLFPGRANAQDPDTAAAERSNSGGKSIPNAINICPIAIAFGTYSVNYERLLSPFHGIVGRIEYVEIPDTNTDASIDANSIAFTLNYRWHRSGAMKSLFLGVFSRYRIYNGNGQSEGTDFDFTKRELTVGLNAGKRWVLKNGINFTFSFGYGFSSSNIDINPVNTAIESAIDKFEDDYQYNGPMLAELSAGFAF